MASAVATVDSPASAPPCGPDANTSSKQFTVGKIDAGLAVLLTDDHHLIEFPTLLLPKGVVSGAIVNISVRRNCEEEKFQRDEFWALQRTILETYGSSSPKQPVVDK